MRSSVRALSISISVEDFFEFQNQKAEMLAAFDIPLSREMIRCLIRAIRIGRQMHPAQADVWLFPADSEAGHLVEHKEDRSVLSKWGNDLRQTYRTIAQTAEVNDLDIHLLMNHILSGVNAGYITRSKLVGGHLRTQQAPCLKETFDRPASRQGDLKADIDPHDIWLSYEELRLRTIAFLIGDATLNNYSSQHWADAILLKDQCQLKEIRNMPLRFELEKQEERFRSQWFDQHRKSGAALRALSYITEYANLSSFTRSCGQQIIEGARLNCPSLLQDPIRKMDTHPTRDPA